jgi:TonB-dependent receptor
MKRMSIRAKGLHLGASVIALSLAAAGAAYAAPQPPADEAEVEELVITGFRGSLAVALEQKREETSVIDAISAEDIADFPDANLAESIQRIPGVSIDRDAGEGRSITVRGLGPDFTRTRINGMEAQATTGGTDSSGGANRGRGFDFNVFAAELFQNITIRKTAAAEVEEGSLGATVDLTTSRPFDTKNAAVISGQYGYNDLSREYDPRVAALYSRVFADGTMGFLVSAAYSERSLFEEGYSSVRWARATDSGGFCSPLGFAPQNPGNSGANGSSAANCATGVPRPANTPANVAAYQTANSASVYIPRLPRYGRLVHDQSRLGITASAQWAPTDRTQITLDLLHSKLKASREENFLEALSFSRNAAAGGQTQVHVVSAEVAPDGTLIAGTFNNVDIRSEQRFDELSTGFQQATLNLEHEFSDRFRMNAFAGRADSKFNNPVQTTVTFDRQNSQGFGWDYRGNPDTPLITWGFDPAAPASWQWRDVSFGTAVAALPRSEIRLRPNTVDTLFESVGLDFEYDINDDFTFKFGANKKTFESVSTEFRRANETVVPALPAGTTVADISTPLTGFGRGLGLPAGSSTGWIVPDLPAIVDLFDIYCDCDTGLPGGDFQLTSITNGNARGGNRTIVEDASAAYIQLDGRTEVLGRPLRGNIGIRYAVTELFALGYSSTGGGTLVTGSNKYSDTLPSLNLAYDVTDELVVRLGMAKVMARPQIGNTLAGTNYLVPTTSLSTTGPNFTASIGNVNLKPFRADTYDLSVEWYFAPESLLSAAFFRKDIDTYIQIIRQDLEYQELTALNPSAFAPGFCNAPCSPTTIFALTSATNTRGGPLEGFEINYQQPFSFLPGPFDDFGVLLNYTHVTSDIDYCSNTTCTTFVTDDLVNLSPDAYNATLYYENDRFSARVSGSFRDRYLQNVPGRNNNAVEGKQKTVNVDASATYNVNDRLQLTFEALNLTDEENEQFVGDATRQSTSVFHHTGRQFYVGARYRFQ